jgi:hypothetical protein
LGGGRQKARRKIQKFAEAKIAGEGMKDRNPLKLEPNSRQAICKSDDFRAAEFSAGPFLSRIIAGIELWRRVVYDALVVIYSIYR